MPRNPKTARLISVGYRAMFTPRAPQEEKEIVVISDDEVEPLMEEDEEWMITPTPAPAPAPTPVVAPVYAVAATPTESSATSPTPVPPLAVPMVDEEIVAPGFKNKTRYTPHVSLGSQVSHIATNKGNIERQCLNT